MEVVRILAIDGNADLNKASSVWDDPGGMNIPHATPLVVAVVNGNVAMCKLLVLFGADAKVGVAGNGAFTLAKFSDVGDMAAFFGAVADWPPLKIAAGSTPFASGTTTAKSVPAGIGVVLRKPTKTARMAAMSAPG